MCVGIIQQLPGFNWLNYYNKQKWNKTLIYSTMLTPRKSRSFKRFGHLWAANCAEHEVVAVYSKVLS